MARAETLGTISDLTWQLVFSDLQYNDLCDKSMGIADVCDMTNYYLTGIRSKAGNMKGK